MEDRGVALRVRLQRSLRITQSQHERLHEIYTELERAIAAELRHEVDQWIDRLGEALHSHFDLEQRVVFPILRRMSPKAKTVIDGLEVEHTVFLTNLETSSSEPKQFEQALSRTRLRLRIHEQTEERLIAEALGQMAAD